MLTGCAGGAPPATFDLTAARQSFTVRPPHGVLLVMEPTAEPAADGDRIVVRTGPDAIAYLKGAQWVDRLPKLIQNRFIASFENAHLMRSVARPGDSLNVDYKLVTDVRRFEVDAASGEATVEISAKLASDKDSRVIAGQIFTAHAPGSAQDGASATHALDAALGDVAKQIVIWAASKT